MSRLFINLKDGKEIIRTGKKVFAMCGGKNYFFKVDGELFEIHKKKIRSTYIEV